MRTSPDPAFVSLLRAQQEPPESPSPVAGRRVLSAEDRSVVVLRYYLGLSAAEIGETLDIDAEDVDAVAVSVLAALRRAR